MAQFRPSKPFTFSILFLTKSGFRDQTKSKVGCAPHRGSAILQQGSALAGDNLAKPPAHRCPSGLGSPRCLVRMKTNLQMGSCDHHVHHGGVIHRKRDTEKSSSTTDVTNRHQLVPAGSPCPLQSTVARTRLPWDEHPPGLVRDTRLHVTSS